MKLLRNTSTEHRVRMKKAVACVVSCAFVLGVLCTGFLFTTAIAADLTMEIGPDSAIAGENMLAAGNKNGPYYIADQYDVVWGDETEVDIFKVEYENGDHEITVAGKNNEKVIAPGTENTYTFAVKNRHLGQVDYRVSVEAWFTGLDGTGVVIPVEAKLMGRAEWMLGGEEEYRPVLELDGVSEESILKPEQHAMYTLYWRWPFESDLNGDGNVDDGDTLDTWLATRSEDISLSIRITVLSAFHEGEGPSVIHPVPYYFDDVNHMAYLYGYPDGTVRPEAPITRAEMSAILYRVLKQEYRDQFHARYSAYPDVEGEAWYSIEVATLANMGAIKGYPDGNFCGDQLITRAEFSAMLARLSCTEISDAGATEFPDIAGHWAEAEIETIEDLNWIEGYPDGCFHPDDPITRAETATVINRVLHRLPEQESDLLSDMITWPDNADPEMWYYLAIQEASNDHTYQRLLGTRGKWIELVEREHVGRE